MSLSLAERLAEELWSVFEREPNLASFSYHLQRDPAPSASDPWAASVWPRVEAELIDPDLPYRGEAEMWASGLSYGRLRAFEGARLSRPEPGGRPAASILSQLLAPEDFCLWEARALAASSSPAPARRHKPL